MSAIWVEIAAVRGSAPREVGCAMKVTETGTEGTIGGGALEHLAIADARRMLRDNAPETVQTLPLGPALGQCCGGAVTLRFGRRARQTDRALLAPLPARPGVPRQSLWLWGAGHVGRAVVRAAPARQFDITWIDTARERFPSPVPDGPRILCAAQMPVLARHAEQRAHHLIFTYSHEIDLALCAALLRRQVASVGLIGSATKWARFSKRLAASGLDPDAVTCPIGDRSLGKHPDAIARSTLTRLMADPLVERTCA